MEGLAEIRGKDIRLTDLTLRELPGFRSPVDLPVETVRLIIDKDEFIHYIAPLYDEWITEQKKFRESGREDDELRFLEDLGFPTLREFLTHPAENQSFFCGLVPVELLSKCLEEASGPPKWVINDLLAIESTDKQVILTGSAFRMDNGEKETMASPQIYIRNEIPEGFAVLGAAHAAVAWRLATANAMPESSLTGLFSASDIKWINDAEFSRLKQAGPHLVMTESSLGHQEVALISGGAVGISPQIAAQSRDDVSRADGPQESHPRMYILLLDRLRLKDAACAAANAALSCVESFSENEFLKSWSKGTFYKTVCSVSSGEFESAKKAGDFVAIRRPSDDLEVALAFCPREKWPKGFRYYKLFREGARY